MRTKSLFLTIYILITYTSLIYGQSVGLVLSGGGAKGMAHLGVIRALEEQGIPIDYIAGTSMGAIVGGLYAAGYSIDEMEAMFSSSEFEHWINGTIPDENTYYFRKDNLNSAWVKFNFDFDSTKFSPLIPVNFIAPIQMDFAFLSIFSQAGAVANNNFDSLFIPFRCVATDITHGKEAVFSKGILKDAIRASMTFPFYFRPISIDSGLMYDGGMVNNFPTDVMLHDFNPDYIIAVTVAKPAEAPSNENLLSVLNNMLMEKQDYNLDKNIGIVIRPNIPKLSITDFSISNELIKIGYQTLMDSLPIIEQNIKRRISIDSVNNKRQKFKNKYPNILIKGVSAKGVNSKQAQIVEKIIFPEDEVITFKEFHSRYFQLINEEYIHNIYPTLIKDSSQEYFHAILDIQINKPFQVKFGGYITTNPQTTFYTQLQYSFWHRYFMNINLDAYFGRFYNSIAGSFRLNGLTSIPFEQIITASYSYWNYFKTSSFFLESEIPSYLKYGEFFCDYAINLPIKRKTQLVGQLGFISSKARFYSINNYSQSDITDINRIVTIRPQIVAKYNTTDSKYFPTKGMFVQSSLSYYIGLEQNKPGTTSSERLTKNRFRHWFTFKAEFEHNFKICHFYSLGLSTQFAWSNIPRLYSYTATKLRCPSFQPTHESNMIYLQNYRDPSFITAGISNAFIIYKKLQFRLAGFYYQPFYAINKVGIDKSEFSSICQNRAFIIYSSLAYPTKLGPIGINVTYYSHNDPKWLFNISFGYLFFQNRIF